MSPVSGSLAACVVALLVAPHVPAQDQPSSSQRPTKYSQALFRPLKWRNIGPLRGGRSLAVAGSSARPLEYFFGAVGGGLWKTVDGGTTWNPVSAAFFHTSSVGAVAVSASNPDIVYVGMGESGHGVRYSGAVRFSRDSGTECKKR